MAKKNAALLFSICFALAACADSATNRSITAPHAQPSLVSAVAGYALTPFGSDASVTLGARVGIAQAANGGRARGYFELAAPFFDIQTEQYSFDALSTGAFPNAKGRLEGTIARSTSFQDLHADVDCLAISGNQAWVSGPITMLVVNGVPEPPAGRYVVWRVQDNGEGANSPPDLGSVLYVGFPQACLALFGGDELPMTPTANIQVSQNAHATTFIDNVQVPIDISVFVPCAAGGVGEIVNLSGTLHMVFHTTTDASGGFHSTSLSQPQGVSGTGLTTGDKYQGTGETQSTFNGKVGSEFTFVSNFKIIGQGPGNNFLVHENFHVTVNPNGEVTVFVDNFSFECK